MSKRFDAVYRQSIDQPDEFWREQAQLVDWAKPFDEVCDYTQPPFAKWFVGGQINLCHNAVDRHAATRPDANALIFVSTETN
ncbi:acetyl-coenzyme A synthetase N-terminal domain-containing protein, partial [Enterococcus lactis]